MLTLLPEWLRRYRRSDLPGDLAAGAVVAVVLAPQSMAYALLAGLPPIVGLYASTVPILAYALVGTSRHLAVGPVAIVSLLVHVACSKIAPPGSPLYLAAALQLALLTGLLQLLLGAVKAGFMVTFLSRAAIAGFTSAAALLIGLSQLHHLLGLPRGTGDSALQLLLDLVGRLQQSHPATMLLGLAAVILLLILQRFAPRFPAPLLVVAGSTLLVALLDLDLQGVKTVGDLPGGLPGFSMPPFSTELLPTLLPTALTIALIGYLESFAVAGMIADKEHYRIEPNRELLGLGAANLAASCFSGYPVTGGFSRTAVNHRAGARTGLAALVTAGLITITLLWFTTLFHHLPKAVLAAIVLVAVAGLVELHEARYLFRVKTSDGLTFLVTFLVTLGFGVEVGIISGMVFSLTVIIWRSSHPHIAELGWLAEEQVFRNIQRYPRAVVPAGMLLIRVDASLYFANIGYLENWLRTTLSVRPGINRIILDMAGVNDMDAVALAALEKLTGSYAEKGIDLVFADVKGPVRDLMDRADWPRTCGNRLFVSLRQAVDAPPLSSSQGSPPPSSGTAATPARTA